MMITDIPLYIENLKQVHESVINVNKLRGKSILVTGATGLIGSTVVDLLLSFNIDCSIYACARSKGALELRFGIEKKHLHFVEYDAEKSIDFPFRVNYLIHAASPASPELYIQKPVETMLSNFSGMQHLLEYAREKQVERVLFVSSSEIYGQKEGQGAFAEEEIGYLDFLNIRSSYASSKRATETLCASYVAEYGLEVVIARPGHIYGPRAKENDRRISSAFMFEAVRGEDLVMKSKGEQLRSYCYSVDCASALLTVLLAGESAKAYNISNPKSVITIRQLSDKIANTAGVGLHFKLPNREEVQQQNPMLNASLDSYKLEMLGWRGLFSADQGIRNTYQILKELRSGQ